MDFGDAGSSDSVLRRVRKERRQIVALYDRGRQNVDLIDDWEDPKFEIYHTQDRYGFIHDQRLPDSGRSEREQKQRRQEAQRSQKWAEMFRDEKKFFHPKAKNREKMINRVYKGVPDSVRGKLWYILLDIDRIKKEQEGTYQKMRYLARLHSPDIRQIDLDVNRTYRDHVMFRERYNQRQQALFHVLAAYSIYNSEVGYCQGMSQIAALLLMYLTEEEDVFWGLSQLMVNQKYAMHGFFIQGFPKLRRFQSHHERILKKFLPKLKKHLDRNSIDTGIYTLKWFFQCFLDRIPFSLTLRVWDLYLLEGERVMIAMAYNILRMHRRYLMKLGMDELIEHLQLHLERDFGCEDDVAIDKLREVMSELASNRLDLPGRPPPEELPQKPFGLTQHLTLEQEVGYRTGFTEKERDFSYYAIQRQVDAENRRDEEDEDEEEDDEGSDVNSFEGLNVSYEGHSKSTSYNEGHSKSNVSYEGHSKSSIEVAGRISKASLEVPAKKVSRGEQQDRPQSAMAMDQLDESVRLMMLQTADLSNGDVGNNGSVTSKFTSKTHSRSEMVIAKGDVVRIHVPYTPEEDNKETKRLSAPR